MRELKTKEGKGYRYKEYQELVEEEEEVPPSHHSVEEDDESDESMYQPSIGDRRRLSSMRESGVPHMIRLGSEHPVAEKYEL
jgi:hypothetical protein